MRGNALPNLPDPFRDLALAIRVAPMFDIAPGPEALHG